ncbi:hypothetical protein RhiirA1_479893 [Rhizophagus irregularis]|uniref:Uncharacterized protein n=1 Tax=Rhizophagus irregularis TaxID=588596 RepID=A0A2N0QQ36_9GLOM|nr:hypothetical protein RhiirA1_479893 [Rhizophagus irregularis]
MASTTNNFILQELGDFLKLLDKETFAFLLEQIFSNFSFSIGFAIYQTDLPN